MPRIILKMKKYYVIYVWNEKNMEFNISETVAKNILAYRIFNKESWDRKAKECNYKYLNQILKNWRDEIQTEQLIIQKKDLKYIYQIKIDHW